MKKKLLVLFLTLTLVLTACTKDESLTIDQIIVNNVVEEITFENTVLDSNIVLPTHMDGYVLTWTSNDPSHLSNDGTITQPLDGEGNADVVLTVSVTSNNETLTKDFNFVVKEASETVENPDDTTLTCPNEQHEENGVCVDDEQGNNNNGDYTYDGYYLGVEGLSGDTLKAFLHDLIDDHTVISYDGLKQALLVTDQDPDNPNNIIMFYAGDSVPGVWDSAATWNREHSWPKSIGGFKSDDAGSDLHHIRATYTTVNSTRGSDIYGEGGTLVAKTDDCYTGSSTFEPRDEVKGDVARMMFYMVVRYEGYDGAAGSDLELVVASTKNDNGTMGNLNILLKWHEQDPVDEEEMARNEAIYGYQNNRNPFIDHPELVELIWGTYPN